MTPDEARQLLGNAAAEISDELQARGLSIVKLKRYNLQAANDMAVFRANPPKELRHYQHRGILAIAAIQKMIHGLPMQGAILLPAVMEKSLATVEAFLAGIFYQSFGPSMAQAQKAAKPRKKKDTALEFAIRYAYRQHMEKIGEKPAFSDLWDRLKRLVNLGPNKNHPELTKLVEYVSNDRIFLTDGTTRTYASAQNTFSAMKKTSHHNPL